MVEYTKRLFGLFLFFSLGVSIYGLLILDTSALGAMVVFAEALAVLAIIPYCVTNIRQTISRYTEQ